MGDGCLLVQEDGRSSSEGGGYSASELPSNTMPTGHDWGSLLLEGRARKKAHKGCWFHSQLLVGECQVGDTLDKWPLHHRVT